MMQTRHPAAGEGKIAKLTGQCDVASQCIRLQAYSKCSVRRFLHDDRDEDRNADSQVLAHHCAVWSCNLQLRMFACLTYRFVSSEQAARGLGHSSHTDWI